MQEAHTVLSSA